LLALSLSHRLLPLSIVGPSRTPVVVRHLVEFLLVLATFGRPASRSLLLRASHLHPCGILCFLHKVFALLLLLLVVVL
jgi:hypothetical protein